MSEGAEWRRLWNEIDGALEEFGRSQAKVTGRFLKDVRLAVEGYGIAMGEELDVLEELDDIEAEAEE